MRPLKAKWKDVYKRQVLDGRRDGRLAIAARRAIRGIGKPEGHPSGHQAGLSLIHIYIPFGEFKTTYPLLFASQTKMDAVFSSYWSGYATLAAKNAFMPITEEMLKTCLLYTSRCV